MPKLIAIGGSAGALQALETILAKLPASFPAPIIVVQHIGDRASVLPSMIGGHTALKTLQARDGQDLEAGTVYFAPPDNHLLVVDHRIELSTGPRENWTRPAIDPTFRTAAEAFGPDCIGIVLSGSLNDGTSGLFEIKRRGGIAIVQDPSEARSPSMPRSARESVDVDWCLPAADIPALLVQLVAQERETPANVPRTGAHAMRDEADRISQPTAYTCPDCGGAMHVDQVIGNVTRLKCHIGHAMTQQVLAAAHADVVERNIEEALRAMNEYAGLCRAMAKSNGGAEAVPAWSAAEEQATANIAVLKGLSEQEWLHPDGAK